MSPRMEIPTLLWVLLQSLTILMERNFPSNWNFPWRSLCPLPLAKSYHLPYSHSLVAEGSKIPPPLLLLHNSSSQPLLRCSRLQLQRVWWPHWTHFHLLSPAMALGSPKPDSDTVSQVSVERKTHIPQAAECTVTIMAQDAVSLCCQKHIQ